MIEQVHISQSLNLFAEGFRNRWELKEYSDQHKPALFVGIYSSLDVSAINNHLGFKLVLFGGQDIPNVNRISGKFSVVVDEVTHREMLSRYYSGPIKRFIRVPFKSYNAFKPTPPGDKIYCYVSGDHTGTKYRPDLLQGVINEYGRHAVLVGKHGHTIEEMIRDYYSQSFVNLQFNPIAGFTTALEMAHMGRLSVSNYPAPFTLGFANIEQIIYNIELARTVSYARCGQIAWDADKFLHHDSDWLDEKYW